MKITASTPLFAVLGNPVQQSLSPILQNGWIEEFGYKGVYVGLEIDPAEFEKALAGLFHAGVQGCNITAPFKERAAAQSVTKTARASVIGSVNCLTLADSGFAGDSTDGDGFITDLDYRGNGWRTREGHIVILGAGGAARALLYALYSAGRRDIHLVNRNLDRAVATVSIVNDPHIQIHAWDNMDQALRGAGLVINASSAGLNDHGSITPDFSGTNADCLVYDTIYVPKQTAFLKAALKHGRQSLGGLGMLVGQGALAFENWFGTKPDFQSGLTRLEKELGQ
jgi:shikimate dehydrogenase